MVHHQADAKDVDVGIQPTALANGHATQQAARLPPGTSPFAGASAGSNWQKASNTVMNQVALSQAFSTLRDMRTDDIISPEQLKTIKLLGEGAFATVEKSMYTPNGGGQPFLVAVKRLRMELFRNQEDLELFVKEIDLMRKLRHRNVVEFIGAGEVKPGEMAGEAACTFVVQEYMGGGTLKQLVTREMLANGRRTYSNASALDICLQMARGLRYLHNSRPMIIHRDLKLENVLLKSATPVEGHFDVKIADFGLSRSVQVKQEDIALRRTTSSQHRSQPLPDRSHNATPRNSFKGAASEPIDELEAAWSARVHKSYVSTRPPSNKISLSAQMPDPATNGISSIRESGCGAFDLTGRTGSLMYMAPEVFSAAPYSEKADVFSFGTMMYEVLHRYIMLSAVAVRGTYEELEAYCARVSQGYRPPIHKNWPPSLTQLLQDCWAQDPSARPSMDEVVTRLEAIQLSGEIDAMDAAAPKCSCTIC